MSLAVSELPRMVLQSCSPNPQNSLYFSLLAGNFFVRDCVLRQLVVTIREITSLCLIFALLAAFPENLPADLYQRNCISIC
jgi:hypothetical protein